MEKVFKKSTSLNKDDLRKLFNYSIKKFGYVKIYTKIDHVSSSGLSARVSAYLISTNGLKNPIIIDLAKEILVHARGDKGLILAYDLYQAVFLRSSEYPYQKFLKHERL
jgi:hypothetical protein